MKQIITVFLIAFCTIGLNAYCQSPVDLSEFEYSSDGVVYISQTDSLVGKIIFSELSPGQLSLVIDGEKDKKFKAKEVVGFKINNPAKNFISVKSDGLEKSILFYENTSPRGAKLCLLKYFEAEASVTGTKISGGKVQGSWRTSIYSPDSGKILPSGNKKLAVALKDCPELAAKVAKKEKGYSVGMIAMPGATDQLNERIVQEYNACN